MYIIKNIVLALGLSIIALSYSSGQTVNSKKRALEITVEVSGLSEKYKKIFQQEISVIDSDIVQLINSKSEAAEVLAKIDSTVVLPHLNRSIFPILIQVDYKEGQGTIILRTQYDHKQHLIMAAPYKWSDNYYLNFSVTRGLFAALNHYMFKVYEASGRLKSIADFDLSVLMQKKSGDFIAFTASFKQDGRCWYSKQIFISADSKLQHITAANTYPDPLTICGCFILNHPYYLDGKKTPEYAAYKFFNLPTEEDK
jgi:hypothetical protein